MAGAPPAAIVDAIDSGLAFITRRAEIFEHDGKTPWFPDDDTSSRLITGDVNLDYSRDERRTLDLTLLNDDNALRSDPDGGLWYDKVIKLYRGVYHKNNLVIPKIAIIEESTTNASFSIRQILSGMAFTNTDIILDATSVSDLANYDIVISWMPALSPAKYVILQQAYAAGQSIITVGNNVTSTQIPFITTVSPSAGAINWFIDPVNYDLPFPKTWTTQVAPVADAGNRITGVNATATVISTSADGALTHFTGIIAENNDGGKWLHYQAPEWGVQGRAMFKSVIHWMVPTETLRKWETQIGEFVIDSLSEDHFPYQQKITGRDYTKRALNSKLKRATSFDKGTNVVQLVQDLAANSRITKFKLPQSAEILRRRLDYAAETSRWEIMKAVANSFNYDVYFDQQGYLVMKKFPDPSFSSQVATFQTGKQGNLVSYSKSTDDSEIYNRIVVTSSTEGADGALPFFGEAVNREPSSPTNIDRIGERDFFYSSASLDSDQACKTLATSWLKIYGLESYNFSFDSITYPWLDVGNVAKVLDPRRNETDPVRYLIDTISLPMDLGPMSLTGKRVTIVQDAGEDLG